MTKSLLQKEFSSLENFDKEAVDNDTLYIELKHILSKNKLVKQIKRVDGLLHRAKLTSENILIGNKILPEIFEE